MTFDLDSYALGIATVLFANLTVWLIVATVVARREHRDDEHEKSETRKAGE